MHRITLINGDGIGPEIVKSVKKVFEVCKIDVQWDEYDAGLGVMDKYNEPLPDHILDSIRKNKVALKGPITTPVGKGFRSVNVKLRKELDLYVNLRPVRSFKGIKSKYEDIDLVIVRENTEDLYAGIEHKIGDYGAESIKLITKPACERIVDFSLDYCKKHNRKRLTGVHKANIMKMSDGLFLDTFRDRCDKFLDRNSDFKLECDDVIVDACAMNLVLYPEKFDTLVMPNLYGDIMSDLCSGLVGGLGMVPGANIGKDAAVFEAVHGSAPTIAGKNVANPSAILLASVMMLDYIGESEKARLIEKALEKVFEEGKVLTEDLGGSAGTDEFTDYLCETIKTISK